MKNTFRIITAGLIAAVVLSVGSAAVYASDLSQASSGALADTEYTLEEMLQYAIQDECAAKAEYTAVINAFGSTAPFVNIVKAEDKHIVRLTELFKTYGYTVPTEEAKEIVPPESLEAAYVAGVSAEESNIAMYEKFLKETLPADVKLVFERLLKASQRHLTMLQNAAEGNLASCPAGNYGGRMRGNSGSCGNRTGSCDGTGNGAVGTGTGRGQRGMRRGVGAL